MRGRRVKNKVFLCCMVDPVLTRGQAEQDLSNRIHPPALTLDIEVGWVQRWVRCLWRGRFYDVWVVYAHIDTHFHPITYNTYDTPRRPPKTNKQTHMCVWVSVISTKHWFFDWLLKSLHLWWRVKPVTSSARTHRHTQWRQREVSGKKSKKANKNRVENWKKKEIKVERRNTENKKVKAVKERDEGEWSPFTQGGKEERLLGDRWK